MNELMEKISKLTPSQKLAAAIGVYAALAAIFWFALIQPKRTAIEDATSQQRKLKDEHAQTREQAENRDEWEKRVDKLVEQLARAKKELPDEREIPDLLRRVSSIGKKIGLEFLLFQPLPEMPHEFYADVPVKLRVEGSYHEVAVFFDRIGKLNRIVNVRDITMSDAEERNGRMVLRVDGTAVTYRFLSDSETQKAKPAPKKKAAAAKEDE